MKTTPVTTPTTTGTPTSGGAALFNKLAGSGTVKKTATKSNHQTIIVDDKQFAEDLHEMVRQNEEFNNAKTALEMTKDKVKTKCIEKGFVEPYERTKVNPDTVIVQSVANGTIPSCNIMFQPTDKYIKIDEERFNELKANPNLENCVEECVTFNLDDDMLQAHGAKIMDALLTKFSDSEIEQLIKAEKTFRVKKGTIDTFAKLPAAIGIATAVQELKPIFALKSVKVTK